MKIRRATRQIPAPKFRLVLGYPRNIGNTYTIIAHDQSWLIDKGHELERAGHKVYKLQRLTYGEWVTL